VRSAVDPKACFGAFPVCDGDRVVSEAAHHQVKAVGDLNGVWGALRGAVGKRTSPITCDDLHARMSLQPGREGRGAGIGKQLERLVGAEIDQDSFEVKASAIVVDPRICTVSTPEFGRIAA
jgi:hypothetical protein